MSKSFSLSCRRAGREADKKWKIEKQTHTHTPMMEKLRNFAFSFYELNVINCLTRFHNWQRKKNPILKASTSFVIVKCRECCRLPPSLFLSLYNSTSTKKYLTKFIVSKSTPSFTPAHYRRLTIFQPYQILSLCIHSYWEIGGEQQLNQRFSIVLPYNFYDMIAWPNK